MDTKIPEAIEYIQKFHHHHFPIVNQEREMVGLVTDRDFLRNAPSAEHNSPVIWKKKNLQKIFLRILYLF